jgi:transposase-like protein
MRKHTFFYGSSLNCAQILHLGYLWLNKCTQQQSMNETGHSQHTVTAFHKHFRRLVATTLSEEDQVIGGEGVIVEVDETKLGKRKYNRGHRVDGVWVVVGVERTLVRRVFMVRVENRSAETLIDIIKRYVAPGSIVHTDMWKGYAPLSAKLNMTHHTVNHSQHFKDAETGVHTNTVEGTNNGLKIMIKPRHRTASVDDHLSEFVWRRKFCMSLWGAFLLALKDVHYDVQ